MKSASIVIRYGFAGLLLATLLNTAARANDVVVIKGNGTELGETPIVAQVETSLKPGAYVLKSANGGGSHLAQIYQEGSKTYLATVVDRVPAQGSTRYTLEAVSGSDAKQEGVKLAETADTVAISIDGKPLTTYRAKDGPKPYYFPLVGPTGARVTRAFPMEDVAGEKRDHPHHRSFWFTHGKVNGIDFWSELKGHGTIKETSRKIVAAGPAMGEVVTTDDWVGPDGTLVCQDVRRLRVYDTEDVRILDFAIEVKAGEKPVVFGDTKEGMFGLRVATSMDVTSKRGGKITTSEGLTNDAAWGKPASWVDYVGPVEGKTVGVAILDHPSSFRHPATWHVRTYGLFAANPFGWKDFGLKKEGDHTIAPGQSISFAYRVILHPGDTPSAKLPAAFSAFAQPPAVEMMAK